jgi:hypothetical protein
MTVTSGRKPRQGEKRRPFITGECSIRWIEFAEQADGEPVAVVCLRFKRDFAIIRIRPEALENYLAFRRAALRQGVDLRIEHCEFFRGKDSATAWRWILAQVIGGAA